jgi:hypothetical protein
MMEKRNRERLPDRGPFSFPKGGCKVRHLKPFKHPGTWKGSRFLWAVAAAALALLAGCSQPGSSATTASKSAVIKYEVTSPDTSAAFIAYGDPTYFGTPAGTFYVLPWSYQYTAQPGELIFLYLQSVPPTPPPIVSQTLTMNIYKDGTLLDTYTWTNSSGAPESHMLNKGSL